MTESRKLRILFLHGSAGGPTDSTATYLQRRYDTFTPKMPTIDYGASLSMAMYAIQEFGPDVIVGESFGASITYELIQQHLWKGPTVLLCPAVKRVRDRLGMTDTLSFPRSVPILIVQGSRDTVVPLADTRALYNVTDKSVGELHVVDDDHSMRKVVDGESTPQLDTLINDFLNKLEIRVR